MCNFCEGKERISNKTYEDGSYWDSYFCKVWIDKDIIYDWGLKVTPIVWKDGKPTEPETYVFNIEYCPKCGKKLKNYFQGD